MKPTILILSLIFGLLPALHAGDPTTAAAFLTSAQVVVSDSYAQKIKGVDFISGNKIIGSIKSADKEFVSILGKTDGEYKIIMIPTAEVLYITGKQRIINF